MPLLEIAKVNIPLSAPFENSAHTVMKTAEIPNRRDYPALGHNSRFAESPVLPAV